MTRQDDLLPLKPLDFLMLLALVDGDRHAYGIKKDLAARGEYHAIGPGTLYRSIAQLLDAGLIADSGRRPATAFDDERRRYFALTPLGRLLEDADDDPSANPVAVIRRGIAARAGGGRGRLPFSRRGGRCGWTRSTRSGADDRLKTGANARRSCFV